MKRCRPACWLLMAVALLLGGCASVMRVDSQVQSFARWTERGAGAAVPQAPQVFRFERLPSQDSAGQAELESLAAQALAGVGWTPAAANVAAPWTVQVSAATQRLPRAPWESPYDGFGPYAPGGFGGQFVLANNGALIYVPLFPRLESPYFLRRVSLVIRHAGSAQVVYETRAAHDGRWNASPALWRAMFDAALQGFPVPPAGERQVNIDLPR